MKQVLPILDNQLPKTISYSALSNWDTCTFYYLLVDIHRLKPWTNSPDTIFGTYIHKAVQDVLSDVMSAEDALKLFNRKWKKFSGIFKKNLSQEDIDAGLSAEKIILNIRARLTEEFGKFKVLSIEERLSLDVGTWPQKFKGFIDTVLQLEDGIYVIIDFKTSGSAFFFTKYKDTIKDYQLSLYKHFYGIKHAIPPDKIETYFIVLEKNLKSKTPIVPIRVTSGPIKLKNAVKWLETALSAINRKKFYRNRLSCLKFGEGHPCAFYGTEYCKK